MYIRFPNVSYGSNKACICGLQGCDKIIDKFRSIKDVRGHLYKLPNSRSVTRKESVAAINDFYIHRISSHRKANEEALKGQKNEFVRHRTRTNQSMKKDVRIALWHFDKRVLEAIREIDNERPHLVPKTMHILKAKENGLFGRGGSIYTHADIINNESKKKTNDNREIVVIPTFFSIDDAQKDLADAVDGFNTFETIEKVKAKTPIRGKRDTAASARTPTSSTSNGSSTTPNSSVPSSAEQGPAKRPKSSLPNEQFFKLSIAEQREYLDWLHEERRQDNIQLGNLLSTIPLLENALREQSRNLENCKSEIQKQKNEKANQGELMHQLQALEKVGGGLNRISLTSRDVIGVNQTVCKELYGFSSFDFLIDFVEAAFDIEYTKPQHATVGAGGSGEGGLSDFEQVLLTLVFTNTLWNYDMIGLLFGIT